MKLINSEVIEEVPWGVYVCLYDGKYLVNEDKAFLSIDSVKGDQAKIAELKKVAKHYGFDNVEVEYWSGQRKISDEEYEEQKQRAKWGLVPDPLDVGALRDEAEGRNARS